MHEPRNVPTLSPAEAEEFRAGGTAAHPAENSPQPTGNREQGTDPCCTRVDVPGVAGPQHAANCPARPYDIGHVPEPLHSLVSEPLLRIDMTAEDCADLKSFADAEWRREALIVELMFAARELARRNLRPSRLLAEHRGREIATAACAECSMSPLMGRDQHTASCRTGRVLRLLDQVRNADIAMVVHTSAPEEPNPNRKENAPASGESHRACDGIRARGTYGEPWAWISTPSGAMWIVDLEETVLARTVSASPREARDWAERIAACVNFCARISTERLEAATPLAEMGFSLDAGIKALFAPEGGAL